MIDKISGLRQFHSVDLAKMKQSHSSLDKKDLNVNEKLEVMALKQMDRSVRRHEQTHMRTAQNLSVGTPTFEYAIGPDGKKYAIGGEVNVNFSIVDEDPRATVEKALRIQRTALAPSDPSPKDFQSANEARIMENKARRKLAREELKELDDNTDENISKTMPKDLLINKLPYQFEADLDSILDLFG